MPSIKQEKMDVSSGDSSDDQNTNENRVQLKEFQLLNTSVPPPTHIYGKSIVTIQFHIKIIQRKFKISKNDKRIPSNLILFYFQCRCF
jgi:hypothetical protein